MNKRLAVIGGGASGLAAAIEAKAEHPQADVTIYERLPKLCKKILVTGNGRCNFTNEDLSPKHFYGDNNFLRNILTSVYADSENYFRSLGVLSYHEDGRIYPRAQQSAVIRDVLLNKAESLGINHKTDMAISNISKNENMFIVAGEKFDAVIIATGGKSSSVHGSDGSGFLLLKKLGHTVSPLYPALCGLTTDGGVLNLLKGVRAEAKASLYSSNTLLGEESGEVQFTDKAISGIPVMNLSHLCKDKSNLSLQLDLCEEFSATELREHFNETSRENAMCEIEQVLSGVVNTKLGYAVINKAKIQQHTLLNKLNPRDIDNIISVLKGFRIAITGTKDFDNAQITCGGVNTDEINSKTLMSNICDGLFICGEALNIHGDCGGYNLHLAWTTGRIAGSSAAQYLRNNL